MIKPEDVIDPKDIIIEFTRNGVMKGYKYRISIIPAWDGREIITQYLPSILPKVGNYERNQELMLKMMGFVYVETAPNNWVSLSTKELYNSHIPSWEVSLRIEAAMIEYNCSFFQDGLSLDFLTQSAQKPLAWISKTLNQFLQQLLQTEKQPSTN